MSDGAALTINKAWYASVFYIAYLLSAWPASILLQKYPTGKVMGVVCFFWGIVCAVRPLHSPWV